MKYWEINIEREIWETIIKGYEKKKKKKKEDRKCCWGFREREREKEGVTFFGGVVERERDLGFSTTKHDTTHPTHHTTPHHRLRVLCSSGWHWVWFCCFCFSKSLFFLFSLFRFFSSFFFPFLFLGFLFSFLFLGFFSWRCHHKRYGYKEAFFTSNFIVAANNFFIRFL